MEYLSLKICFTLELNTTYHRAIIYFYIPEVGMDVSKQVAVATFQAAQERVPMRA